MRTVNTPFRVSIQNGLIQLDCAGVTMAVDPATAEAAGRRLVAGAEGLEVRQRIGAHLIDSAARATSPAVALKAA